MTEVGPRELIVVKRGWRANDRHGLFAAVRHHKARFKMDVCADVRQLRLIIERAQGYYFGHRRGSAKCPERVRSTMSRTRLVRDGTERAAVRVEPRQSSSFTLIPAVHRIISPTMSAM
jgi:hypothetical protein